MSKPEMDGYEPPIKKPESPELTCERPTTELTPDKLHDANNGGEGNYCARCR